MTVVFFQNPGWPEPPRLILTTTRTMTLIATLANRTLPKSTAEATRRGNSIGGISSSLRPYERLAPGASYGLAPVGPVGRGANGCKTSPACGPVGDSL